MEMRIKKTHINFFAPQWDDIHTQKTKAKTEGEKLTPPLAARSSARLQVVPTPINSLRADGVDLVSNNTIFNDVTHSFC